MGVTSRDSCFVENSGNFLEAENAGERASVVEFSI